MGLVSFAKNTGAGIFLIGAVVGVLIPQPLDFFYFLIQNWLYTHPDISKISFILINIFTWYILDSLWYLGLFLLAYYMDIKSVSRVKMITTIAIIISLGAIIGIIWRFLG
jgi:hypothetical protein